MEQKSDFSWITTWFFDVQKRQKQRSKSGALIGLSRKLRLATFAFKMSSYSQELSFKNRTHFKVAGDSNKKATIKLTAFEIEGLFIAIAINFVFLDHVCTQFTQTFWIASEEI